MIKILVLIFSLWFVVFSPKYLTAFGKNKITYQKYEWKILRTPHLDVYYPQGKEKLARLSAQMGEEAVRELSSRLQHDLLAPVPLIVYPNESDFRNTNIIPQLIGEGTGGFTEFMRRRVVLPFNGSYRDLRHVLTHEMVHAFQLDILLGSGVTSQISAPYLSVPLWIMEGMAESYSLGWDHSVDMTMRDALFNDIFPSIQDLNRLYVPTMYSIYKLGQSFICFAREKYGDFRVAEMLKNFRDLKGDTEEVFLETFGKSQSELNDEWRRYLKRKYWPMVLNWDFFNENRLEKTDHQKKIIGYNIKPVISPNGKKIAYFSNYNFYTHIVIAEIDKKNEKGRFIKQQRLAHSYRSNEILYLSAFSNQIHWMADNHTIIFAARSGDQDYIYLYDTDREKIITKYTGQEKIIRYPHYHAPTNQVMYVGIKDGVKTVYRLNLKDGTHSIIFSTEFEIRELLFLNKNKTEKLLFISNYNVNGNLEKRAFQLFVYDFIQKSIMPFFKDNPFIEIRDLSYNHFSDSIYFSARKETIFNIYRTFLTDSKFQIEQMTNVQTGAFFPNFHFPDKKLYYTSYHLYGYDIIESAGNPQLAQTNESGLLLKEVRIRPWSLENKDIQEMNYSEQYNLNPNLLMISLGYSKYGMVGFAQSHFTEMLGNQDLFFLAEYSDKENGPNFQLSYLSKENRYHWHWGVFRKKNLFNVITLTNLNELFHDTYFGTTSLYMYGIFTGIAWPFSPFLRIEGKIQSSRYEETFHPLFHKEDVYGNLHTISASLIFDNVLWGRSHPMYGWRLNILSEKSIDFSEQDIDVSRIELDIRRYFFFFYRYSFAFRLKLGTLYGNDAQSYLYEIGGYATLRGHPYRSYYGRNLILFNAEFRFPFIDIIKFAWPFPFAIGGLAGVWFWDVGAAWSGDLDSFYDNEKRMKDLKSSFGCGLRMTLLPFLIFRIDFATPWDGKEYQPMRKWRGEFSIGFDY